MALSAVDAWGVLRDSCGVTAIIGLEIEWYVRVGGVPPVAQWLDEYLRDVSVAAQRSGFDLHSLDKESGAGQVEAALHPLKDMAELVQQASMVKALAHEVAAQRGAVCDFSAKPYASDYGSALHLHVHVENEQGENLFYKRDDALSDALRFAVSGLLAAMPDDMQVFAPQHESRSRFVAGFHAPVNMSWGFNNRTTALRIPDGTNHCVGVKQIAALVPTHYRRIEHRVAGADADVDAVIVAVLRGVCAGLLDQQEPPEPIYGDAVLSKDIKSFVL